MDGPLYQKLVLLGSLGLSLAVLAAVLLPIALAVGLCAARAILAWGGVL